MADTRRAMVDGQNKLTNKVTHTDEHLINVIQKRKELKVWSQAKKLDNS